MRDTIILNAISKYFGRALNAAIDELIRLRPIEILNISARDEIDVISLEECREFAKILLIEIYENNKKYTFFDRLIADIRTWLRDKGLHGNTLNRYSDGEIMRDYILPALKLIETNSKRHVDTLISRKEVEK